MTSPQQNEPWPPGALKKYEKVRLAGRGAFGSVWRCRTKDGGKEVAIKFVGCANDMQTSYAEREISVLRELDHPNVVKLVEAFDPYAGARCVVLSLVIGPTVELLLVKGGALGKPAAEVISAGLIGAGAFLHSRAVLHRDLKPDNLILMGAHSSQEALWSDGEDAVEFAFVKRKWKLVLIDFGFARPLGKEELSDDIGYTMDKSGSKPVNPTSSHMPDLNDAVDPRNLTRTASIDRSDKEMRSSRRSGRNSLNASVSKSVSRFHMNMSAVGNRYYAAPEIVGGVKKATRSQRAGDDPMHKILAENAADYGMIADAFSVGCILRYVWTGVPPSENVNEYINAQTGFLAMLCGMCFSKEEKKTKRYRYNNEIPQDIGMVIKSLSIRDKFKRMTLRACSESPVILEINKKLGGVPFEMAPREKVAFLNCAVGGNQLNKVVATED